MRRSLIALPVLVVLLAAPAAFAGGWATVGLSSTPSGAQPGKPWPVDLTILQHGRTPLADLEPVITITNGDTTRNFAARPTGEAGVYHADVVFPAAGRWEYEIDDGFISGVPHTYPAVQIGAPSSAPAGTAADGDGDGGPSALWLIPGIALLAAGVGIIAGDRRRRRPPQPRPA